MKTPAEVLIKLTNAWLDDLATHKRKWVGVSTNATKLQPRMLLLQPEEFQQIRKIGFRLGGS